MSHRQKFGKKNLGKKGIPYNKKVSNINPKRWKLPQGIHSKWQHLERIKNVKKKKLISVQLTNLHQSKMFYTGMLESVAYTVFNAMIWKIKWDMRIMTESSACLVETKISQLNN